MIPYNPCGRAVEIGRSSYRTKCRFFADSDAEADIVWYPAPPDAPALGFPSAITSSEWDVRERDGTYPYRTGVGEVFDAPRRRLKPAEKPAATGHHVCGTREDFEQGAKYNPALPPRLYRPDGLPVCCAPGEGILFGAGVPAAVPAGLAYTTPAVEVPAGLLLGAEPQPAGGLLGTTPPPEPTGGLLGTTPPPEPPPGASYNVVFHAPGGDYYALAYPRPGSPNEWDVYQYSWLPPGYRLIRVDPPGLTTWELYDVFNPSSVYWYLSTPWDGTGTATFQRGNGSIPTEFVDVIEL